MALCAKKKSPTHADPEVWSYLPVTSSISCRLADGVQYSGALCCVKKTQFRQSWASLKRGFDTRLLSRFIGIRMYTVCIQPCRHSLNSRNHRQGGVMFPRLVCFETLKPDQVKHRYLVQRSRANQTKVPIGDAGHQSTTRLGIQLSQIVSSCSDPI